MDLRLAVIFLVYSISHASLEITKQGDVTIPRRVRPDGSFVSHEVQGLRARALHLQVDIGGQPAVLALRPTHRLLGPGFVVERRRGARTSRRRARQPHCFFHGHVLRRSPSHVALSTCDGLKGLIRMGSQEYIIEPFSKANASKIHPHILYKRSANEGTCGNADFGDVSAGTGHHKRKRSVSMEKNVETLVVADKKMVDYYSSEDIETYILTIMNMVSSIYHDASIGNAINIVLVRLILLEEEETEDLTINQQADDTLRSFCRWQQFVNPKDDSHPNHHDVAILLTRFNICTRANEPCSTLGLAEVAGMCQPHRSCNVNEDTGLALAYTVAHEMGHNFGMVHDGPHSGCQAPSGERQHVMSPHLNSDASPLVWSSCSREEITKFLDRDWGNCLDDEPSDHEFSFPELPPGAMYDADHQCRLQYGNDAEHCEGIEDVCQTLWCRQDNKCVTRLEPAAEGTRCGRNMWCQNGRCTEIGERPDAIDGAWGPWSPWSSCSRTCGAGVSLSSRHCDNPRPAGGGTYCIGERKRYRICNIEACPENTPSFRSVQCSSYDDVPYKEELYAWSPVATPMTPCQLHCKPEGKFFSVMLSDTVEDGTECNPGTRDICIGGKCRHVGCDWIIDSNAQEDRCGVCLGDGTQCITIRGNFTLLQGIGTLQFSGAFTNNAGYVEVVVIPKGTRNIRIDETEGAINYLAVQGEEDEFYLNGQWFIQWSGEYRAAGTTLYYQRDGDKESLHIPGPTKEDLRIMLLYQAENPGLTYEYTIPNASVTRAPEFLWSHTEWTACSESCGGGIQISKAKCIEKETGLVDDKYCSAMPKPTEKMRLCNRHQCPAKWWSGPWQHCSASCGARAVRRRTVICVRPRSRDQQIALLDEECDPQERPPESEPCPQRRPCVRPRDPDDELDAPRPCEGGGPCSDETKYKYRHGVDVPRPHFVLKDSRRIPVFEVAVRSRYEEEMSNEIDTGSNNEAAVIPYYIDEATRSQSSNYIWKVGIWSKCSRRCGGGLRRREAMCSNTISKHIVVEELCDARRRPVTTRECNSEPCVTWMASEWSQCSKECGEGETVREVTCPKRNLCDPETKPADRAVCLLRPCIDWVDGPWSECSVTCGFGVQIRHIQCVNLTSFEPATGCASNLKPDHRQPCNLDPCLERKLALSECRDIIGSALCHSLRHMCGHPWNLKESRCCLTCRRRRKTGS